MASNDAPSWLTPEEDAAPAAVEPVAIAPSKNMTSSQTATQMAIDEKELPGIILVMRLANMGVSIALMTVSILMFLPGAASLPGWVLAIYATCGGLLICCLETQLKFLRVMIAVNFGFLFNSIWRFMFYLLLGSVAWAYNNLFGKIVAIALWVMAVFNTYILCRYPSYRQMREKIAEEEDKRIEARISKEVKAQALNQLRK